MKQQLTIMLDLQDEMNQKVHPEWRSQNYQWYRAIWVECAELMDHFGWKWWKKHSPNHDQVVLELIDIWHFGLSDRLQAQEDRDLLLQELLFELDFAGESDDFRVDIEAFAGAVLRTRAFDIKGFARLLRGAGLSFSDLYRSYVGKNVLNLFRQDHGYKDGTYQKVWHGQEDNEHLVQIVADLDTASPTFRADLYEALAARYPLPMRNATAF